jgi:hypothetical protein
LNEPANLVLEHLRAIRDGLTRIERTQQEHGDRLSAIEIQMAGQRREHGADAEQSALVGVRIDRLNDRGSRIERRLDLVD